MRQFFKESKIVLAIIVGALLIGGAIYFSGDKIEKGKRKEEISGTNSSCSNISELPDGALKLATKVIDGDTFFD